MMRQSLKPDCNKVLHETILNKSFAIHIAHRKQLVKLPILLQIYIDKIVDDVNESNDKDVTLLLTV